MGRKAAGGLGLFEGRAKAGSQEGRKNTEIIQIQNKNLSQNGNLLKKYYFF